jgi:hypothetical protein
MQSLLAQQAPTPIINPTTFPAARFSSFGSLLNIFIPLLSMGAALIFLVMLLWGAYTILTAGGNAENVKKAQKMVTTSIIGLIIVISAYLIVKLVAFVLQVDNQIPL